jgi:hypothetical protein
MIQNRDYFFYVKGLVVNIFIKRLSCFLILFSYHTGSASQVKSPVPRQAAISTIQEALSSVRKVISNFPANDIVAAQTYEKEQSAVLVKSARVLYDNARAQILDALQEIDNRIAYWQYQKNHQWRYFLTKSPLKWVTGNTQDTEIENNLEQLQSHQGELYVLLGQLAQLGTVYDHEYKTVFAAQDTKGYAWIDGLLNLLPRIKVVTKSVVDSSPFIARAALLKAKLERVRRFKSDILSDIVGTQVPAHIERNWLKYGTLMMGLLVGYNTVSWDQVKGSFESVKSNIYDPIMEPVKRSIQVLFPADKTKQDTDVIISSLARTHDVTLDLAKQFVIDASKKYGIDEVGTITSDMDKRDYGKFQKFLGDIAKREKLDSSKVSIFRPTQSVQGIVEWAASQGDYAQGLVYLLLLIGVHSTEDIQKFVLELIAAQKKEFKAVRDLVLLTPAVFTGWLGYSGYKKFTTKDYSSIRRALVDINSLFVDQTRPLDDEQYGKMMYLVYNLKKRAEKDLPLNVRADFIHDLEKIELQEFDVAAKRRIVEDMFKKYAFLGLAY